MTEAPASGPPPGPNEPPPRRRAPLLIGGALLLLVGALLAIAAQSGSEGEPTSDPQAEAELRRALEPLWEEVETLPAHAPSDPAAWAKEARERYTRARAVTQRVGHDDLWERASELKGKDPSSDSEGEVRALIEAWVRLARHRDSLVRAVRAEDQQLALLLLQLGAKPSEQDGAFEAALRTNQALVVKELLERGATYPAPLRSAAHVGALDVVRLLLDRKVDPNGPAEERADPGFRPPLGAAAGEAHPQVVALLLERGADPNLSAGKKLGWTPLESAVRCNRGLAARRLAVIELLLKQGAKPEAREDLSEAPLVSWAMVRALRDGAPESLRVVELLFAAGATLDPGPEPFDEGDKSFDVPPKTSRVYYREPPLLKGLSVLGFDGKVTRAQVQERVLAVVALARAARPDEVRAQTPATVNRLAQDPNGVRQVLAPCAVRALQPAALDLRHVRRLERAQLDRFVASHPGLRALHLGFNEGLKPADLAALAPLEQLEHLTVDTPLATPSGLEHVAQLAALRSLSLDEQGQVPVPVAALAKLQQLRALDLHETHSAYADLAFLEGLTQLERLDLRDTRFPLAELARLDKLPQLSRLILPDRAGDPEVELLLQAAPQLQELGFLRRSKLSDAGLQRVAAFARLRRLSLDRAQAKQLSPAAWEAFAAAAPEVEVVQPAAYESAWEMILRETQDSPRRR